MSYDHFTPSFMSLKQIFPVDFNGVSQVEIAKMTLAKKRRNDVKQFQKPVKKLKMENLFREVPHQSKFVIMPWDDKREIISLKGDATVTTTRWELIQSQLCSSTPILNCSDLVSVIKSYNVEFEKNGRQTLPSWKCLALQKYFMTLDSCQIKIFFQENGILSTMRNLCLQLRELVPKLELLKTGLPATIKLHQIQIASLLANAFFCTFPKGKADCPSFNFNTLYETNSNFAINYNIEKIKCIIHYFGRIHKKQPAGHLSFSRLHIPNHKFPRWDKTTVELSSLIVDDKGKIEDQEGFLQVDFANRYVGGGVLGKGCVQEEIRFVICPELIASRLFTESLADNEALFVTGAERYSCYTGYSNTFKFAGDYQDSTPRDESGTRKSFLIIVDALYFHRFSEQFRESKIIRELKKAYVGFKPSGNSDPLPLATGNWGCGAFGGDPQLKSILQLMASSQARRNILYLTFGNVLLKKQMEELYRLLKENSVNVGMLYRIIRMYNRERSENQSVFEFVTEAVKKIENKSFLSKLSSSFCSKENNFPSSSVCPHQSEWNYSSVEKEPKTDSWQTIDRKEKEEDVNFPSMEIDFEALDENIANQKIDSEISSDAIRFVKEVDLEMDEEKLENPPNSPDLFFEEEKTSSRERENINSSPVKSANEFDFSMGNYSTEPFDGGKNSSKGKSVSGNGKFIQKKITDCFATRKE